MGAACVASLLPGDCVTGTVVQSTVGPWLQLAPPDAASLGVTTGFVLVDGAALSQGPILQPVADGVVPALDAVAECILADMLDLAVSGLAAYAATAAAHAAYFADAALPFADVAAARPPRAAAAATLATVFEDDTAEWAHHLEHVVAVERHGPRRPAPADQAGRQRRCLRLRLCDACRHATARPCRG